MGRTQIREIPTDEFDSLFGDAATPVVFGSAQFNELNRHKAEKIKAMALFEDETAVCGQIFGLKDGEWRAPFSAPFSAPSLNGATDPADFYNHIKARLERVRLVWPAPFYPAPPCPVGSKVVEEYNYHYPLERFSHFEDHLSRSGRYNHHRALKHDFEFIKTDDIRRAYDIIAANRRAMGYPLAMTLAQVSDTVRIVPADFFLLRLNGEDIASAMLFHTAKGIAQVIYWGDLPAGRPARAMNHLAWRVFGWYASNRPDVSIIDIGPASSDGILNKGLADFKLSLGCVETRKPTLWI